MNIEIQFTGFPLLFDIFQDGLHNYVFSGSTLSELIEDLVERFGDRVRESIYDPQTQTLDPTIQIVLNKEEYVNYDLYFRKIEEGDQVTFLKLLAGG
jgi:hypothetical protein